MAKQRPTLHRDSILCVGPKLCMVKLVSEFEIEMVQ